jgi:oxygen-independent coproporphyrinogen-3 oxidase
MRDAHQFAECPPAGEWRARYRHKAESDPHRQEGRDRLVLAAARAPRYTSYPTAAQFAPDVNAEVFRAWLGELRSNQPVSLYVHIPFCRRLCWYCGCNTRAVNRGEPIEDYVAVLADEIALVTREIGRRPRVSSLHFGGGSPNSLTSEELDRLFDILEARFDFSSVKEIAVELDPTYLDLGWVETAGRRGLTRASLGVQEFSPAVQAAINRPQPFAQVARAVKALRANGVASINLDLMYGLPKQRLGDVLATIDQSLELAPERFAVFGYAHVPWMKLHQKLIRSSDLPGVGERLEQSAAAAERLIGAGYVPIGLDHFALPNDELAQAQAEGRLRRNFQGYTTDRARAVIGLGASAISGTPNGYAQNFADVVAWRQAVLAGTLPTARGVVLTWEDRLRADVIERLMCDFAADLVAICERHGTGLRALDDDIERLASSVARGLVTFDGRRLAVTGAGRPLVRLVCAVFDRYLVAGAERHSSAA